MKKLYQFILLLIICLSIVGCGKKEKEKVLFMGSGKNMLGLEKIELNKDCIKFTFDKDVTEEKNSCIFYFLNNEDDKFLKDVRVSYGETSDNGSFQGVVVHEIKKYKVEGSTIKVYCDDLDKIESISFRDAGISSFENPFLTEEFLGGEVISYREQGYDNINNCWLEELNYNVEFPITSIDEEN